MISLSKNLYIVDELKWAFIDAILNKRMNEAIFWMYEYYESGYRKESWQLLFATYISFYYKNYSNYYNKLIKMYEKWKKDENFDIVLDLIYRFNLWGRKNTELFEIVIKCLKCKEVSIEVDDKTYKRCDVNKELMYGNLVRSLEVQNYRNLWFYICYAYEKSLKIISNYYKRKIKIIHEDILDKRFQVLMYVYKKNGNETKRKIFKIKINKEVKKFYESISVMESKPVYDYLSRVRKFKIPKEIGCFNLERYNYDYDEIIKNYFYKWESMANCSPIWNERIECWFGKFDKENNIYFPNDDLMEKFYEKYGLEPDEQSEEVHMKGLNKLKRYPIKEWIDNLK